MLNFRNKGVTTAVPAETTLHTTNSTPAPLPAPTTGQDKRGLNVALEPAITGQREHIGEHDATPTTQNQTGLPISPICTPPYAPTKSRKLLKTRTTQHHTPNQTAQKREPQKPNPTKTQKGRRKTPTLQTRTGTPHSPQTHTQTETRKQPPTQPKRQRQKHVEPIRDKEMETVPTTPRPANHLQNHSSSTSKTQTTEKDQNQQKSQTAETTNTQHRPTQEEKTLN
uniref:Uncharacterized protein n=1 Tax=Biomphalaria glabrata TaxID=6526 RepID=A0A2C9M712_BIOGL